MAPERDPEHQAAKHAAAALEYIQQLMRDHEAQPDAHIAAALSNLAVYEQMRALALRQQETAERIRSNTDTLEHLAGGLYQTIKTGADIHHALERLDWSVRRVSESPLRRWTEKAAGRWHDLRLRHMPRKPISSTVRRRDDPAPYKPVTPMFLVDEYTGTKFEQLLTRLLVEAGWEEVKHIGGAGDMGVDILAISGDVVLAVQAKRYRQKGSIGSGQVRDFVGGAHKWHNANAFAFVTTTDRLTPDALSFAEAAGVMVIDRAATTAWIENGIVPKIATPPGAVAVVKPKVEGPEQFPPPPPPRRPQVQTALLLLLALMAAGLIAWFPAQKLTLGAMSVAPMLLAGMLWLDFQWKAHGWRVGFQRYWSDWTVDTSSGKPVFIPPA